MSFDELLDRVWYYDIEIFAHDSLIVFISHKTKERVYFHQFYECNLNEAIRIRDAKLKEYGISLDKPEKINKFEKIQRNSIKGLTRLNCCDIFSLRLKKTTTKSAPIERELLWFSVVLADTE